MTSAPFGSLAATVLAMNVRTSDTVFAAGMPDRKMWSIHSGVYAVLSAAGMSGFSPQKVQAGALSNEEIAFAADSYFNVVSEIQITLVARKNVT